MTIKKIIIVILQVATLEPEVSALPSKPVDLYISCCLVAKQV